MKGQGSDKFSRKVGERFMILGNDLHSTLSNRSPAPGHDGPSSGRWDLLPEVEPITVLVSLEKNKAVTSMVSSGPAFQPSDYFSGPVDGQSQVEIWSMLENQ